MEIDIFPIPSSEGVHRYIGTAFLGLIIITYIVGAFMLAQKLIGEDKELLCLLATIPIFIGGYAVLILLLHGIKQCLYAYFKLNRNELNNRADQENMDVYIVKHLEEIQKKLDREPEAKMSQSNIVAQLVQQDPCWRRLMICSQRLCLSSKMPSKVPSEIWLCSCSSCTLTASN